MKMKNLFFLAKLEPKTNRIVMAFIAIMALTFTFYSCDKLEDEMGVDYTSNETVLEESLTSDYSDQVVLDYAIRVDTMTSTAKVAGITEKFVRNPVYYTEVKAEGDIQKIDSYDLTISNFTCKDENDQVTNYDDKCIRREKRQTGSFNVNGRPFKFSNYTESAEEIVEQKGKEDIVCLPHTLNAESKPGNYRVIEIGNIQTIDGKKYKKTRFGVAVNVRRDKVNCNANGATSGTYANETVEIPVEFYVLASADEPTTLTGVLLKDKNYTIEGNDVVSNIIYTMSFSDGTKRDTTFTERFTFGNTPPQDVTKAQKQKGLTYVNTANNTNTAGDLIKTNSLTTTHVVKFADNSVANLDFLGNYGSGSKVIFQGTSFERTEEFLTPKMTQLFVDIKEIGTTTDNQGVQTVEYRVNNKITIGSYTNNNFGKVFVVLTDELIPTTLTAVALKDKNYTIEGSNVKSNIIYSLTFSNGTKRDTTFTQLFPFSATPAQDVTRTQPQKGLSYINSTNSTNTSGTLIKVNTLTSTHVVKFADGSTANLAFIGTYGSGSKVLFSGSEFERTEEFSTPTMTQLFVDIQEIGTTTSGNIKTTEYKVNNEATIGSKKIDNFCKVFVNVDNTTPPSTLTGVVLKDKNWTIVNNDVKSNIIYTMSFSNGSQRDTTFTQLFPFTATPANDVTRTQLQKGLSYVNSSHNTNTTGGLIKTNTLTSTHVVRFADNSVANLPFVGTYGSGSVFVFQGTQFERTEEFSTPTMTQSFSNIQEVGTTTSGGITTTEYKANNAVTIGSKTINNNCKVYVQVAAITMNGVVLKDKNWTIVNNDVKSNIIYTMSFSNGTQRDTTFTQLFPFGATPASNITRNQSQKGLAYVNSSDNTNTTGGLIKTNTLTSTHVVKLNDGTTANLPFLCYYGSGSVVVFQGTSFERTESYSTPTMTQNFVNIQEIGTTSTSDYSTTEYQVNNTANIGTKNINNNCKVYVQVEDNYENPEKGKLIGHRGRTYSPTTNHNLQVIDVMEWANGYDVYVNGVFNGYWKKSDLNTSVTGHAGTLSATCNGIGGKWMPAVVSVDSGRGYWYYTSKSANGTQYASATSYLNLNKSSNYWSIPSTWAFVGGNLVVKDANGNVVLTVPRQ